MNDRNIYKGDIFKISVNNWLRRLVWPLYDRWIVLTSADKQAWKSKNIQVIGNFTSLKPAHQNCIGGGKICKQIVAIGRWDYQKNFDLLIKAWAIVKISHPDWNLQIWGSGSQTELQQEINALALSEVVKLCGETKDMESVYENASIFVLSSRFEGFPLVVSEAMQFGLPCVSFSLNAVTDRIIDGKTGFLADNRKRTPEELAMAICKCIESVTKSDELSRNAYSIIQQYDTDTIMKCWTNLFESVASNISVKR